MVENNDNSFETSETQACDPRVSRKEFLTKIVKRATVAGALLAAPAVVDKFLIPPAQAATSTSNRQDTNRHGDTSHFHDRRQGRFQTIIDLLQQIEENTSTTQNFG